MSTSLFTIDNDSTDAIEILWNDKNKENKGQAKSVQRHRLAVNIDSINEKEKLVILGKGLSALLRRNTIKYNLYIDEMGYVRIADILYFSKSSLYQSAIADGVFGPCRNLTGITIGDIRKIVDTNDKQRFSIEEKNEELWIRATQGHSIQIGLLINDELALVPIKQPSSTLVHGTYYKHVEAIIEDGLMSMERSHIHMVDTRDAKSGFRQDCELLIHIDMQRAMSDGILFYKASNGVVLTKGKYCINKKRSIPSKFISTIEVNNNTTGTMLDDVISLLPPNSPIRVKSSEWPTRYEVLANDRTLEKISIKQLNNYKPLNYEIHN
jgi:2'-phosphotransferase